MRTLSLLALFAVLAPLPTLADTVLATSHITAITIYPQGAQVTREVTFTAPPGSHDLLITDLPADVEPTMIRLASPDATLGAFALRTDRLPPRSAPTSPAIDTAKVAVKAAKAGVADAQKAFDAINAQVEAQQAQIAFLTGLKVESAGATADSLTAIADMVQTKVLAARQAAQTAQLGLPAANDGVTKAQDTLTQAQAALDALSKPDTDYTALSVAVVTTADTGHLTVTHYTADAAWAPVYDITLDRKTPKLTLDRGILVSQYTGEDWAGVDLTLSTARPSAQSSPSDLYPNLRRIYDSAEAAAADDCNPGCGGMAAPTMAPAAMVESREVAKISYWGDTVV